MTKKPGRALERLVATIEKALQPHQNVQINSPAKLKDLDTGELREFDVLVAIDNAPHQLLVGIECRDRSRKTTVNEIEGFWAKCQRTGINRPVIVSTKGFTKGALRKAAGLSVGCSTVRDVGEFDWLKMTYFNILTHILRNVTFQIKVTDGTLPKADLGDVEIRDDKGNVVPSGLLIRMANDALMAADPRKMIEAEGQISVKFEMHGFKVVDTASGAEYTVEYIGALIGYDLDHSKVPIRLVRYEQTDDLEASEAAIAEVRTDNVQGQFVLTQRDGEGPVVAFVGKGHARSKITLVTERVESEAQRMCSRQRMPSEPQG